MIKRDEDLILRMQPRFSMRDAQFYLVCRDWKGIIEPLTIKRGKEEIHTPDTSFYLRPEDCQVLMDDMWMAGIRPSHHYWRPEQGDLRAIQQHLKDMRLIVADKLKIDLLKEQP